MGFSAHNSEKLDLNIQHFTGVKFIRTQPVWFTLVCEAAKAWEAACVQLRETHKVFQGGLRSKSSGNLDVKESTDFTGSLLSNFKSCFFWGPDMY